MAWTAKLEDEYLPSLLKSIVQRHSLLGWLLHALVMHTPLLQLTANDIDSHISIPLGISIGLIASFIQSLGLTIQRKSHVLNSQQPQIHRKADYRRP
jgi:hypothetical protein